jgi:hypothetical protein
MAIDSDFINTPLSDVAPIHSASAKIDAVVESPPRFSRPPAGVSVDEVHLVPARSSVPQYHLLVRQDEFEIYLDRMRLEKLVAARPTEAKTEQQRLAFNNAGRAEQLLEQARATQSPDGAITDVRGDALYAILEQLELGNAAVRDLSTKSFVDAVNIRFYGSVAGPHAGIGHITVGIPHTGRTLLWINWWVR